MISLALFCDGEQLLCHYNCYRLDKTHFNKLALMLIAIITVQICCLSKQWKTQNEQN
jgi:hypothetical protein